MRASTKSLWEQARKGIEDNMAYTCICFKAHCRVGVHYDVKFCRVECQYCLLLLFSFINSQWLNYILAVLFFSFSMKILCPLQDCPPKSQFCSYFPHLFILLIYRITLHQPHPPYLHTHSHFYFTCIVIMCMWLAMGVIYHCHTYIYPSHMIPYPNRHR